MLEARTAIYEWALRAGREELGDDWVDAELRPEGRPFAVVRDEAGLRFRHLPLADDLPGPMVEAAEAAQEAGEPTALESLHRILARAGWLTSSRALFWTPYSPVPALLAQLVESYGIDAELHERDPDALAKLLVHLPSWFIRRGQLQPALDLLEAALDNAVPARVDPPGPTTFACRSAAEWHRIGTPGTPTIQDGWVVATTPEAPRDGDVALGWVPADRFPHELLRLLPAWSTARVVPETR